MSKLNMKEWINEIIQKKEVVAMPIMNPSGHRDDRENGTRCRH